MEIYACTLHPRATPESRRDDSYVPTGLGDPDGTLPTKWFTADSTASLHEFLSSGLDLLVITIPLTSRTTGLITRTELDLLSAKPTFASNVSRGAIINTHDLVGALNGGVIAGAALDVTDPEPLPDGHPLWTARNVLITPHVSGDSESYTERLYQILKYNLYRLSEGKPLANAINRTAGY